MIKIYQADFLEIVVGLYCVQMVDVAPSLQGPVIVGDREAINRAVDQRKVTGSAEGELRGMMEQAPNDSAVADDEDGRATVTRENVLSGSDNSVVELTFTLSSWDCVIRATIAILVKDLWMCRGKLHSGVSLEDAEVI